VDVLLRPVAGDLLLAAVLTVLAVATLEGQSDGGTPAAAVVLAILSVAPLAARRQAPVLVTAVIAAALAGYALAGYGDFPSGALGLVIAVFTVAMLRDRLAAAATCAGGMAVVVLAYVSDASDVVWSQVAQAGVILLVAWILGASARRWAREAELAAAAAARAVAEERLRIARELHDVVSHHMSVVSLQAGLAAYVVDSDVPTARQAILTASEAGRDALGEMRRLLGALRTDDDEPATYRPQPGLAQLDALVDRVRGAGLDVEVSVAGAVRDLPPGPDLCAYRMVQESLTNVLKHAGPARARVSLEYGPRTLTVTVADDGSGAGEPPSRNGRRPVLPDGHGIRGMRERAELYGGVLVAGRSAGGGFTVRLRLPEDGLA
jgi:signal transduction histidine kinase